MILTTRSYISDSDQSSGKVLMEGFLRARGDRKDRGSDSKDKGEDRWNRKGEGKGGKRIIKSYIGTWPVVLLLCCCF